MDTTDIPPPDAQARVATAARMYDYYLGGIHNFPADQEAARRMIELYPGLPATARENRAFLRRAVRHLARVGIRQFLDIGSGIPTQGNVHEIAQREAPTARVVYVDTDPVAVAESLDLLAGNPYATAIRGDLRTPGDILGHPNLRALVDLEQPVALLLAAVLHFVPDEDRPYDLLAELVDPLAPGSYLVVSHAALEAVELDSEDFKTAKDIYHRRATTSGGPRSRADVERFFAGLDPVEPGVVWLPEWQPDEPGPFGDQPQRCAMWAGVARKPPRPTDE